ncbi:MAG: hypothetical protein DMG11_07910 [Acidobacteria bacterium]|nr:MAG: hypothetical protein DMG11_07910 [Acidobacteriota bacterium]
MKSICAIIVFFLTTAVVQAQQPIPKEVLEGVADDLAALDRLIEEGQKTQESPPWNLGPNWVKVTGDKVPARVGGSSNARIAWNADTGEMFRVVDKVTDWYAVERPGRGPQQVAWMPASSVVPSPYPQGTQSAPSRTTELYNTLTTYVTTMRDKYKDNPYLFIGGFSVHVGVPPSVTVNFTFK